MHIHDSGPNFDLYREEAQVSNSKNPDSPLPSARRAEEKLAAKRTHISELQCE